MVTQNVWVGGQTSCIMVYVKMVTCENVHDFCYEKEQNIISLFNYGVTYYGGFKIENI